MQCHRVQPHRKRAVAAGSDLCPQREGVRTALCKITSSPSNRWRADAAEQSRSWQAAGICVLETDLPGGHYGMAEAFTEKLIEKMREYMFLYSTGHPEYKNLVKKLKHGERSLFSLILCIHHHLLFHLQLIANRRSSSSLELDIVS